CAYSFSARSGCALALGVGRAERMEPAVISTEVEKSRVQGSAKEISPLRSQAPSSRDDKCSLFLAGRSEWSPLSLRPKRRNLVFRAVSRRSLHCGRKLPSVEMTSAACHSSQQAPSGRNDRLQSGWLRFLELALCALRAA